MQGMRSRGGLILALALMTTFLMAGGVYAKDYPGKPINLIIPWFPGGLTDTCARTYAPLLEKYIGTSVIVVNKGGASGSIGSDFVLRQKADGYNILYSAETPGVFQVMGFSKSSFSDFDPIMMMIQDTKVIVVPKNSPYKTFKDLIADIRKRPGKVRQSYSGPGASGHIQGLLFKEVGLKLSMTPFGGASKAMLATISGQVEFTFGNTGTVKNYVRSGDLRVLAVFSNEPSPAWPGIPAMTEDLPETKPYLPLGFPNCILMKKGTPEKIKAVITKASEKAVKDPVWQKFTQSNNFKVLSDIKGAKVLDYWKRWTSIVAWMLYDSGAARINPADFGIPRFKKK